jgi:hypothetical protein
MRVSKDVDLLEIEALLGDDLGNELRLSQAHKKSNLVFLSRFLQFVITLAKKNTSLRICYPHLDPEDQDALDKLVSDPMTLIPILMTQETLGKGNVAIKSMLNQRLVKRFNQGEYKSFKRYLQLIAVDHSIERYAYPESMYRLQDGVTTYELRSSSHFDVVLQDYLSSTLKISSLGDYEVAGIGELIHELLLNTEEHAKADYKLGLSQRSVRGAILNSISINTVQDLSNVAPEGSPAYSYLTSLMRQRQAAIHLLEISIFDSGSGIAKSFSRDDITFQDEVKLFLDSFKKGITSKINGVGVGRGLPISIKIINARNGYIAIRSGKISVYRDFLNDPVGIIDNDIEGQMSYMDEIKESALEYSEMEDVAGVAYSILVPVK